MRNGLPVNPVKKWDERAKAGAWGGRQVVINTSYNKGMPLVDRRTKEATVALFPYSWIGPFRKDFPFLNIIPISFSDTFPPYSLPFAFSFVSTNTPSTLMFFPWPPPPCIFFHVSVFFPLAEQLVVPGDNFHG